MAAAQSLGSLLTCSDVCRTYGQLAVLRGITLELALGETLAIMGRSGCGKSTLLRCIALLEQPDSGKATLKEQLYMSDGRPQYALWQIRSQITMVFQNLNLFAHLSGLRNITLPLEEVRNFSRTDALELAYRTADELDIRTVLNQYPETLSGGQAQRIALARALVLNPSVLLLDEITSALDQESVRSVVKALQNIRSIQVNQQLGIILVTHDLRFARGFADRIAFMHEGTIVETISADQPAKECSHAETRLFLEQSDGEVF